MSLSQFHAITPSVTPGASSEAAAQPSQIVRMNWAEEMDKIDDSARNYLLILFFK